MRGVETNQQPLPITAGCDDASKLAKSVSQATSLTRSNLECDLAARLWQVGKYCVQTLCYQLNSGIYACAEVGTGKKDEEGLFLVIGSLQPCFERLPGFLENVVIVCRQIDQVAGMSKHDFWFFGKRAESSKLRLGKRFREPLHVIFHENLNRGATDRLTAFKSLARAARYRHVRT